MFFSFQNKKISGITLVIPEKECLFTDEMHLFHTSEKRSLRLKEVMGYDRHRIVEDGVCASDLAEYGCRSLFASGQVTPQDIDALVYVSLSPDYFIPPTSRILHGRLGLRQDAHCVDLPQGCTGFIEGLLQAFMLLDQQEVGKVLLITSDVLSRKVSRQDRNSYPLIGDAAAITLVEKEDGLGRITANMKNDGTRAMALSIPAGGFRQPASAETAIPHPDEEGNLRAADHLVMRGSDVFNFVMADVPPMIEETLQRAGVEKQEIDYYFFHQPNAFMLKKLADKLGVSHERMPYDLVSTYGNSSCATIPATIVRTLRKRSDASDMRVCLAGFGVGLSWGAIVMQLGMLSFCDIVEYPSREKEESTNGC